MSHQGQQLFAPGDSAHEVEQVALGLVEGSYVLSTPDGTVAECGAGVLALLGATADMIAGQPTVDALTGGADAETRAAFEQLLQAGGTSPQVFRVATAAGAEHSLQFVVVPVPLTLGWEFASLLGELGSRHGGAWHPEALRLRHGRPLATIERACAGGAPPDPGERLAGVLVVVRDVDAPALTRDDVARRTAEQRAAARVAAATARSAGPATGPRAGADDAEHGPGAAIAERDEALARARAAEQHAARLQGISKAARAEADAACADAQRVRAELSTARDELQEARSETALTRGQLTVMRRELESADIALAVAHQALDVARGEELAAAQAERDILRAELATVRQELDGARAELDGVRGVLESTRAQLDATLAEPTLDEPRGAAPGASPAGGSASALRLARDPALELPPSAPGEALALVGPDGTFERLDEAFCSLLGCREENLRAAHWPSIVDRENVAAHKEIARALRAGEIDSAPLETVFMHARGLLVPIAGTVSVHRAAGGAATHLLLRVDVSPTS